MWLGGIKCIGGFLLWTLCMYNSRWTIPVILQCVEYRLLLNKQPLIYFLRKNEAITDPCGWYHYIILYFIYIYIIYYISTALLVWKFIARTRFKCNIVLIRTRRVITSLYIISYYTKLIIYPLHFICA